MCQDIAHLLVPPLRRCVFDALARWTHHPHSRHLTCSLVQHPEIWICLHRLAVKDLAGASNREAVVNVPVNNQWHRKHRQPTGSRQVSKRKTRHVQQWGSRNLPGIGLRYDQMASTALTYPSLRQGPPLHVAPGAIPGTSCRSWYIT